eukprot:s4586_g5.t1
MLRKQMPANRIRQVRKVTYLGSSFHAAVIFDPEEIMPETLWAAVETVQGGGVVCIVPEPSAGEMPGGRHNFFGRLMRNLEEAVFCIPVSTVLEPLRPIVSQTSEPQHPEGEPALPLTETGGELSSSCPEHRNQKLQALLALTCNREQRQVLLTAFEVLEDEAGMKHQVVITGRRGRGKMFTDCLAVKGFEGQVSL